MYVQSMFIPRQGKEADGSRGMLETLAVLSVVPSDFDLVALRSPGFLHGQEEVSVPRISYFQRGKGRKGTGYSFLLDGRQELGSYVGPSGSQVFEPDLMTMEQFLDRQRLYATDSSEDGWLGSTISQVLAVDRVDPGMSRKQFSTYGPLLAALYAPGDLLREVFPDFDTAIVVKGEHVEIYSERPSIKVVRRIQDRLGHPPSLDSVRMMRQKLQRH